MKSHLLCLALACGFAAGARADPESDRIAAERGAANTRLAGQERECQARFIVAACLDAARKEHRATMTRLRQQQLQIDEARRRETAAARRKAIAERSEAQRQHAADAPPDVPPEAPQVRVRRVPEPAPLPRPAASGPSAADRAAAERRKEEQFEARRRAAQAHREEVERRTAARAAQGKVAAPLPTASGASAAR